MRFTGVVLLLSATTACGPTSSDDDDDTPVADAALVDASGSTTPDAPSTDAAPPGPDAFMESALNESDAPAEADYCVNQFPKEITVPAAGAYALYGQIYEAGLTDASATPAAGIVAQVGFSPLGQAAGDPRTMPGWTYVAAVPNGGYDFGQNNDEYMFEATNDFPAGGAVRFVFRFSFDGGASWTYCDNDGAGSDPGLAFDPAQAGTLTTP